MSRSHSRKLLLHGRALAMRHSPTTTEALLWEHLTASRLGVAFRRQVPIGRFIADFCAPSIRLVIEVDGEYHSQRTRADARRDRILERLGYLVVRIPAALVASDIGAAVGRVRDAIARRSP